MPLILGIDPGLQKTGWGIINAQGSHMQFVACGTVRTQSKAPLAIRLMVLHQGIKQVILTHMPDQCAIEETFVNSNAKSSLALGHARGALMMTASLHDIPVHEYAATLVKKTITGSGRAEKGQIQMMIKHLLPQSTAETEDEADALAIALSHATHARTQQFIEAGS
jgi:crossover junction endodeoxyribonuclease RuvC